MKQYRLAINAEAKKSVGVEEALPIIADVGFDGVFTSWSEDAPTEAWAERIARLGLIYQSIHAPFGKVETLWDEGEAGDVYTDLLIRCLLDCHKVGVPVMVVHPIKGMDRHSPNPLGLSRFSRLVEAAEKTSVRLAFENVEGIEYLDAIMKQLGDSSSVGFCWDTGHEMCYNFSEDVMKTYGDKLIATHFNDNLGITDPNVVTWHDDLHLFPFDGKADWQGIMNRIRRHGYEGFLTFELTDKNKPNRNTHDEYAAWDAEKFYKEAYDRAARVAAL